MKKVSDRRKIHHLLTPSQDDEFEKHTTPNSQQVYGNEEKIIKQLQTLLKEEREKRVNAEEDLKIFRQRSHLREKEFHQILQKSNQEVKKYSQPQINPENKEGIQILYEELLSKFQLNNKATNNIIQQHYRDNYNMMERRVGQVYQKFQQQLTKNKRLSEQSYKNIKNQVQCILFLAKGIDDENKKLQKQISQEKFKNKLLNEEKNLLLEEIVEKKRIIINLHRRAKTSEKQSRISVSEDFRKREKTPNQSTYVPKFFCEPSIDVSEFNPNKSQNLSQKKNKIFYKHSKFSTKRNSMQEKAPDDHLKTIVHLKKCLERQKKKVQQLGSIVTQIQNKNSQINEAIVESFEKSRSEGDRIPDLLKSQKLFQTIKDLKKRLVMCEKPSLLCGWGDVQIQSITTQ